MSEGDSAIDALQFLAARAAKHYGRVPTPIQKDHHLFASIQSAANLFDQLAREELVLSRLLKFLARVDNFYLRQRTLLHTLAQFDQTVFSLTGVMVGLERWSRRSQYHGGSGELPAHDRDIASVVARRLLLLIRRIMFFIDHYESKILHGCKNSRS